jgi:hypothetical protein
MKRIICILAVLSPSSLFADWTPPANPDPQRILDEAADDARDGRYADALAKHVWFHENALKYQRGLYGVRLSFALGYWVSLGHAYPPALQKLKSIRDETEKRVRGANRKRRVFEDFSDVEAIDKALNEEPKSTGLFVWLDSNNPAAAKEVFPVAEPALIKSKQYRLCGKYIDANRSFADTVRLYNINKGMSQRFGKEFQEFRERNFSNSITTLVALLVQNDRKADALRIAEKALKERDDPQFREELEKAKQGDVPAPWP